MSGHTPGPWYVEPPNNGDISDTDARETYHWSVRATCTGPHDISFRLCRLGGWNKPGLEADARLIAAAPDLLAHLQFAVKVLGGFPVIGRSAQVEAMRAAIAKATGEPA